MTVRIYTGFRTQSEGIIRVARAARKRLKCEFHINEMQNPDAMQGVNCSTERGVG